MKKDAYYFPHFSNARHDRKIKRITKELGVEGYGIYFMILEVLREQTDLKYPVQDIDLLADEFGTSEQKVRIVITNYDLFTIDEDEMFFSPKQNEYLQPYFKSSERARDAANKRWEKQKQLPEKCDGNANAMQMQSDGNASKVKKSKEEKSKEEVDCPSIIEYYNNTCTSMPKVEKLTAGRKKLINARCKEHGHEDINKAIKMASESEFLSGKNDRGWIANFDWIFNATNFVKIIEGNYSKKAKPVNEVNKKFHYTYEDFER